MNITGGTFNRKKIISSPIPEIQPTSSRVREALFSCLGPRVEGCRFADLFAGNGTVGLEALSRGAAGVVFVEKRKEGFECITRNVNLFPPEYAGRCEIVNAECAFFLKNPYRPQGGFDIVFLDPPYYRKDELKSTCAEVVELVASSGVLNPGGVVVCQYERGCVDLSGCAGMEIYKEKHYGRTTLSFLRALKA